MDEYTTDDVRQALRPIASLISKSEKAQQKLTPGTWQHTMMLENVKALRIASALMGGEGEGPADVPMADLEEALRVLGAMIERVGNTKTKFEPGTSQHSLQRNRLKALCIARRLVEAELAGRGASL